MADDLDAFYAEIATVEAQVTKQVSLGRVFFPVSATISIPNFKRGSPTLETHSKCFIFACLIEKTG